MSVVRILPLLAAAVCSIGFLDASDAEASHRRGHRRRCCESTVACEPECCMVDRRASEEWVEWHPDRCGGHHHRYRAVVDGDCRRETVEVPMHRHRSEDAAVVNDCACRR